MGGGFNVFNLTILIVGIVLIISGIKGQIPQDVLKEAVAKVRR